ncbi:MAG: undecaprenyl-phosphate glucose phosphotransferase [Bacteroidaceae bacterium]|nr:undecaprenyl-phosphate glucose phosphotransferase [Bacteroidaceae bacterium]
MSLVYQSMGHLHTPHYKRLMVLMTLVYILCDLQIHHHIYDRFVRGDQLLRSFIGSTTLFVLLSLMVMWVFRWPLMTWNFMLPFYGFILLFLLIYRWFLRQYIKWYRKRGRNTMSVIFIGNINIASELYKTIEKDHTTGFKILGYFADEPRRNVTDEGYLGKPEEALAYIEGKRLHNVYCMLPSSQNDLINAIMRTCAQNIVRYYHIPDSFNYQRHTMSFSLMNGTPVFSLHNEPLTSLGNRIIKRCFDFIVSSIFLVTLFPFVYIVFGMLIKLSSPGPVFFKQMRSGLNGKEFYCYKFRSMRVNVDSDKVQATKDDPRKTRIGEFMRRTSIDELPQFINVWLGNMSIVGPRPHMLKHTEQYSELIASYMIRHFAKPGITGYAQVTGFRGETQELWQMEGRIQKDIWYIEHWTFALDLFIIWKTIYNAIHGEENAY